ncbi:MAG: recombinase family protein [Clostridium sp.]|nr:recombinase family protein [Clostridium sp.]
MNIVAYCRVSTDKTDQLNSLENQKKFFTEYAEKNKYNLVRMYADEGISGTKTKNRKEFQRLMRDAESGLFQVVVVKDISRLARNTVDLLNSVRKLEELNIKTVFLNTNMESLGDSEFVLTIFGALAQEESANMSKRVKFGKKINAESGRVPNFVYGYDKTIGDYFNLTINKKESAIVQEIFEWYVKDGYGAAKIANMLNEQGLKTKRGCRWSQNAICRILTNEIYTGKIVNGKQEVSNFLTGKRNDKEEADWIVVEKPELQIISREQFDKAQAILHSRYDTFKINGKRDSSKHLFSTLIRCKECGWSYRQTVRKYQNTYIRWVCSGRNARGADSCPNKVTIDEGELIEELDKYFRGLADNKENVIQDIVQQFIKLYKTKDENKKSAKELNSQIAKLQNTRQKYMDMYAEDLITKEELKKKMSETNLNLQKAENELKWINQNISKSDNLKVILNQTFKQIENIPSVAQLTNAQLKELIEKIEVDKDGNVEIYLKLLKELGLSENVLINNNYT